jgi:hypothetical protein
LDEDAFLRSVEVAREEIIKDLKDSKFQQLVGDHGDRVSGGSIPETSENHVSNVESEKTG